MARYRLTFAQKLNIWTQNTALVLFGLWLVYQFVIVKYVLSPDDPAHLNLSMKLSGGGTKNLGKPVQALNMEVTAQNPTANRLYLLPSIYSIYGLTYSLAGKKNTVGKNTRPSKPTHAKPAIPVVTKRTLIGSDRILSDISVFNAGESNTRSYVLHVPKKGFDAIEIVIVCPATRQRKKLLANWKKESNQMRLDLSTRDDAGDTVSIEPASEAGRKLLQKSGFNKAKLRNVHSLW